MTPDIVQFRKAGNLLVEVSRGSGFRPGTTIYGITVLEIADSGRANEEGWRVYYVPGSGSMAVKKRNDLSCAQDSMFAVNNYIDERIKGKLNA